MQTLVYIVVCLVLGLFFATKAYKFFFTPKEDLYSDYRNEYDYGAELFKKILYTKRVVYTALSAVLLSLAVYEIFFK